MQVAIRQQIHHKQHVLSVQSDIALLVIIIIITTIVMSQRRELTYP